MTQLGQQTGLFQVHCTQDAAADFTRENLKNYDIVMFYTTGDLPIKHEDLEYFLNDWLKQKGHGFIGFHSATDTYRRDGAVLGHDRRHDRQSSLDVEQDRHDHGPRHRAPGLTPVRQGVPDQGRDLSIPALAAREGSRPDEPQHGEVWPLLGRSSVTNS